MKTFQKQPGGKLLFNNTSLLVHRKRQASSLILALILRDSLI
ncbi:hypothetical protein [Streptococcus porcinus]|nr:hypothetical protein [Streptococcus porcinus]